MAKAAAIILGIAAGALLAPLVVVLIAYLIWDPPPGARGNPTFLLIAVAMALAALVGGAMGAVAGIRFGEGRARSGLLTFGWMLATVAVLTLLGAGGVWAVKRVPKPPASELQKDMWARAKGPVFAQHGQELGQQLLGCHARANSFNAEGLARECPREAAFRIGSTGAGYDNSDHGWRWESVKTPRGDKVIVRPDPLLKEPGPIFEFDQERLLVQRETPDAPAFAVDSPLPAVERYVQCLSAAGPLECREFEGTRHPAETGVLGPGTSHDVRLATPTATYMTLRLFPQGRYDQGPFELHVFGRGRRYMFAQGGRWHVTARIDGVATDRDPAPDACELKPAVPCRDDKAQAVVLVAADLHKRIAARVRVALRGDTGERVIVRFDPNTMPGLAQTVERELRAQRVELVPYGPVENFEARLEDVTVYVWLPTSIRTPPDQTAALARWTDRGGRRREVHVHWAEGTLDFDGRQTEHPPEMDQRYLAAAEIDPADLIAAMNRMVSALTSGEVHVTTPAGTDLRFRVGDRPFNRQIGVSPYIENMRLRIDRHTEVPPGVLRVAPVETSVNGVIAFPSFWIREGVRATGVRLEFTSGRIARATAIEGQAELENYLRSQPALMHFREFCLGMNPWLELKPGDQAIPYYGYGAGVVRLSLGDNEELGGTVRGGAVRWNFFTDATVVTRVGAVVTRGRLAVR